MGAWLSSILGGRKGDGKAEKKVEEFDDIGAGVGGDVDVDQEAAVPDGPIRVPGKPSNQPVRMTCSAIY
eukprot:908376-Rhodomonas_salina.2